MMTVAEIQRALLARGYDLRPVEAMAAVTFAAVVAR
jgi:hypothetical protein